MPTEILPGLFVGTREDAENLGAVVPGDWTCISVTEYRAIYGRKEELPREPRGSIDWPFMKTGKADSAMLDLIAEEIWRSRHRGKKVLVHCVHAHERSPLAIAWYLVWIGKARDIDEAYTQIRRLHPTTELRSQWLVTKPIRHAVGLAQAIDEIEQLRRALRYLRKAIPGHDAVFASCGFEEFRR